MIAGNSPHDRARQQPKALITPDRPDAETLHRAFSAVIMGSVYT
jgi:hypothetical protein